MISVYYNKEIENECLFYWKDGRYIWSDAREMPEPTYNINNFDTWELDDDPPHSIPDLTNIFIKLFEIYD